MMELFNAYNEWLECELEESATIEDFNRDSMLPIAYTTYGDDEEYEIQISYDYENQYLHNEIYCSVEGKDINIDIIEDYDIEEMIENFNCNFEEMIYTAVSYLIDNELI